MKLKQQVVELDIKKIIPYEKNPKLNGNVGDVKRSIEKYGYNSLILVDEKNVIIAGHTRRKALIELGYKKAKVLRVKGFTEEQKKRLRILDNRVAEVNDWHEEYLKLEIKEIADLTFLKEVMGDFVVEQVRDVPLQKIRNVEGVSEKLSEHFAEKAQPRGNLRTILCPECKKSFLI